MRLCSAILLLLAAVPVSAGLWKADNADQIKTIAKELQPGDTLVLADGEWNDAVVAIHAEGTETQPILVSAQTPGNVIFTGSSTFSISGSWITVRGMQFTGGAIKEGSVVAFRTSSSRFASHCRLTECSIIDYNPADKYLDYKWVCLYGRNNRVDHCTFIGKRHQGTLLVIWPDGEPNYHRIDHNYFGPRPEHGRNGAEIIRVGTSDVSMSTSRSLVEYNVFEKCNEEMEIISNKSCENVYRYNTFLASAGTLTLRHGNRCDVYGNWFFGNRAKNTGGVRIIGEDHKVYDNWFQDLNGGDRFAPLVVMDGVKDTPLNGYYQVKNALVRCNIFVDCSWGIIIGARNTDYSGFVPADTIRITENSFFRTRSPLTIITKPLAAFYAANTVSEGTVPDVPGFASVSDEVPQATLLLQRLRDDGKIPTEILPVDRSTVGASWSRK